MPVFLQCQNSPKPNPYFSPNINPNPNRGKILFCLKRQIATSGQKLCSVVSIIGDSHTTLFTLLLSILQLPANYKVCFVRLQCCQSKILIFLDKNEKFFQQYNTPELRKNIVRRVVERLNIALFLRRPQHI